MIKPFRFLLKTALCCALLALALGVRAQSTVDTLHPSMVTFTTEDGLPSNTIICSHHDIDGRMWFGTESGLCSYDGTSFAHFDHSNVQDPTVLLIDQDERGGIWFVTIDGRIYQVREDSIFPLSTSKHLDEHADLFFGHVPTEFDVIHAEDILLGTMLGTVHIRGDNVVRLTDPQNRNGSLTLNERGLWSNSNRKRVAIDSMIIRSDFDEWVIALPSHLRPREVEISRPYTATDGKRFAIGTGGILHSFDGHSFSRYEIDGYVSNSILFLPDSSIMVGTRSNGIFRLHLDGTQDHFLMGDPVISLARDFQGGIWVGTNGKGLQYIPELDVSSYPLTADGTDIHLLYVSPEKEDIHILDSDYRFTKNGALLNEFPELERNALWSHGRQIDQPSTSMVSFRTKEARVVRMFLDHKNEHLRMISNTQTTAISFLTFGNDTVFGTYKRLLINKPVLPHPIQYERIQSLMSDAGSDDQFWAATSNGIYRFKLGSSRSELKEIDSYDTHRAYDRLLLMDSMVVGISVNRILAISDADKHESILLETNLPYDIHDAKQWNNFGLAATSGGLVRFTIDTVQRVVNVLNLSETWGLTRQEVKHLMVTSKSLYFRNSTSVYHVPLTRIETETGYPNRTIIERVLIDGKAIGFYPENIEIFNDQSIEMNLSTIGYRNRRNRSFEYKIEPLDSVWRSSDQQRLFFYSLPAGDYSILIKAQDGALLSTQLKVADYFYQRAWFIILITTLVLVMIALPFYMRYRMRILSARFDAENAQLQIQRITAQLNPHFIFNALSSIQSFVLDHDAKSSNKFLVRFSRHIRNALDASQQEATTLGKSLEIVEDYLKLEQMRLQHSFEYEIALPENRAVLQSRIPTMLIQPYVENAVTHGIMQLDVPGRIKIIVSGSAEKSTTISIQDNGPGLSNPTNSKGLGISTEINRRRLKLINRIMPLRYEISFSAPATGTGTHVNIVIHHETH